MGWVGLTVFVVAQGAVLFCFYRVVLRPLPAQVNALLSERHLKNQFTDIDSDTAKLVRDRLLALEAERLEAIVRYAAEKGKRLRTTTEKEERAALTRTVAQLTKTIDRTRRQVYEQYSPPVLAHLRNFENLRLVAAINKRLDGKAPGASTRR